MAGQVIQMPSGRASQAADKIEIRSLKTLGAGAEAERLGIHLVDLASRLETAIARNDSDAIARLAGAITRLSLQANEPVLTDLGCRLSDVAEDRAARGAVGKRLIQACCDRLIIRDRVSL
ncbi:hypothetical protein ACMA5I_07845 [Paracoccaceae bacterium GXU_MW_L88]